MKNYNIKDLRIVHKKLSKKENLTSEEINLYNKISITLPFLDPERKDVKLTLDQNTGHPYHDLIKTLL